MIKMKRGSKSAISALTAVSVSVCRFRARTRRFCRFAYDLLFDNRLWSYVTQSSIADRDELEAAAGAR